MSIIIKAMKRAVVGSGESLNSIAKESGVDKSTLSKLVRDKGGISVEKVEALAKHFGLEITIKAKVSKRKSTGG